MVTSGEKTGESKVVISHTPTAPTEEVPKMSRERQDFRKQTLCPCHEKPEWEPSSCCFIATSVALQPCHVHLPRWLVPCSPAPSGQPAPLHVDGDALCSESRSTEPGHTSLDTLTWGLPAISGPQAPQPSEVWAVKPQRALRDFKACNVARACSALTSTTKKPRLGGQTSCTKLYGFCSEGL